MVENNENLTELSNVLKEFGITADSIQADSFYGSLISGIGLNNRNTLTYNRHAANYVQDIEKYEILHETENIATNIIESLPEAMGEKLPIFKYPDPDIAETINAKIAEIIPLFVDASIKARLTGGSGILIHSSGELNQELPCYTMPTSYVVLEGGYNGILQASKICKDSLSPNFEKPETYRLKYTGKEIHHSRILPFYGVKPVTLNQKKIYKFWGIPVLVKSLDAIETYKIINLAIKETLDKFSRLVIEIENFMELMKSKQGRDNLKERSAQSNFYWNFMKTLLISKGEKVYHLTTEYEQLEKILPHVKEAVCSSCDTPYSKIFNVGKSSSLSGSRTDSKSADRADERQWSEYAHSKQKKEWLPNLDKLVKLWLVSLVGECHEKYELEFPTILQLTEAEEAELSKSKADTAKVYYDIGAVNPEEVRLALAKNIELESAIELKELDPEALHEQLEQLLKQINLTQLNNVQLPLNSLEALAKKSQKQPLETLQGVLTGKTTDDKEKGSQLPLEAENLSTDELTDKEGFLDKDEYHYNYEDDGYPCQNCVAWERYSDKVDSDDHSLGICKLMGEVWGLAHCDLWENKSGKLLPENAVIGDYSDTIGGHSASNMLDAVLGHSTAIIGDDSTKVKKIIQWFDWKIGLQYQPFDTRFNALLPVGYGGVQNTKAPDGMNCDVYVGNNLNSKKLFQFWLNVQDNPEASEHKYVIGFSDRRIAEDLIKSFIPSEMVRNFKEVPYRFLHQFKVIK